VLLCVLSLCYSLFVHVQQMCEQADERLKNVDAAGNATAAAPSGTFSFVLPPFVADCLETLQL